MWLQSDIPVQYASKVLLRSLIVTARDVVVEVSVRLLLCDSMISWTSRKVLLAPNQPPSFLLPQSTWQIAVDCRARLGSLYWPAPRMLSLRPVPISANVVCLRSIREWLESAQWTDTKRIADKMHSNTNKCRKSNNVNQRLCWPTAASQRTTICSQWPWSDLEWKWIAAQIWTWIIRFALS